MPNKSAKPSGTSTKSSAKKPTAKKAATKKLTTKKLTTKKAHEPAAKAGSTAKLEQYFASFLVNLGEFDQMWRGSEEPEEGELEARFEAAISDLELFARLLGPSFQDLYLRLIPEQIEGGEEETEG